MLNEINDANLLKKIQGLYFFITALTITTFLQSIPPFNTITMTKYLVWAILIIVLIGLTITFIDFNRIKDKFFIILIKKSIK